MLTHFFPKNEKNLLKKLPLFGKYSYVDNVDDIFIRIFADMRIIRMNRTFPYPHGHP